jgi:branched-chain amino acid transport system ATP-binding protein
MRESEQGMLQVDNITKNFGGITAVADVSFAINNGEVVSLIGPNGAGKTTCFNLITGFYRPTAGRVQFEGTDITAFDPHRVARLGVVRTFQKTNVLPRLNVFENVLAARHLHGETSVLRAFFPGKAVRVREKRVRDEAADLIETLGLLARIDTPAESLSCGELRLLEVAVALSAGPRLLMLDEPAAGLNTQEAERLADILKQLVGTRVDALLLVEHNMSLVMSVSHRVVVLNFGRKLMEGSPEQVRNSAEVIEAYLGKPVE